MEREKDRSEEMIAAELAAKKGRPAYAIAALIFFVVAFGMSFCMVVCGVFGIYYLFFSQSQPPSAFLFPVLWVMNLKFSQRTVTPFISWEEAQVSPAEPAIRFFLAVILGIFLSITFFSLFFLTLPEVTGRTFRINTKLMTLAGLLDWRIKGDEKIQQRWAYIIIGSVLALVIAIALRLWYQCNGGR